VLGVVGPPDLQRVGFRQRLYRTQEDRLTHDCSPLVYFAGSGTARVITRHVAYPSSWKGRPQNILAITFTNKAASETQQRLERPVPGCRAWITTIHSVGARLVHRLGLQHARARPTPSNVMFLQQLATAGR
jgi:DNA helicase-2/ATP-dependent DNA helicase PcrA